MACANPHKCISTWGETMGLIISSPQFEMHPTLTSFLTFIFFRAKILNTSWEETVCRFVSLFELLA